MVNPKVILHSLGWGLSTALVAGPVFVFAWAWGGMRADLLRLIMPWVTLGCLFGILFFPQCRPGEAKIEACRRVWGRLLRDPLTWAVLVFFLYLLLPLLNVGESPLLQASRTVNGTIQGPRWPNLPFCVSRLEHVGVIWWFVPTLVSALGVRHALTRAGKRGLFEMLVWNGALLAALGFVQIITKAQFPYWNDVAAKTHFFSVFAYPNMGGAFFTFNYALALGLWLFRIEEGEADPLEFPGRKPSAHPGLRAHYPVVAVSLLFCAVLATLSRAAIVLTLLLSGLFLAYVVLRPFAETGMCRARRFRSIIAVGGLLLALLGVVYVYAPPDVGRELKTLNAFSVSDRVTGKGQYHTRVATAIMRDHPLFGVGGWGYRHFSLEYLRREKDEKALQTVGGANVHNDYLQFLAEHGAVGFILMVVIFHLLAKPMAQAWRGMIQLEVQQSKTGVGVSSLAVFLVEPPVLWILLGSLAVLVHAFGDCPLRAGSVLSLLYVSQAIAVGFLPRLEDK